MIHQPLGGAQGQAAGVLAVWCCVMTFQCWLKATSNALLQLVAKRCSGADIEIQANEILHHKLTLNGYLAEFTGKSMEQLTMDTDRDFFMSAEVRLLSSRELCSEARPHYNRDLCLNAKLHSCFELCLDTWLVAWLSTQELTARFAPAGGSGLWHH